MEARPTPFPVRQVEPAQLEIVFCQHCVAALALPCIPTGAVPLVTCFTSILLVSRKTTHNCYIKYLQSIVKAINEFKESTPKDITSIKSWISSRYHTVTILGKDSSLHNFTKRDLIENHYKAVALLSLSIRMHTITQKKKLSRWQIWKKI